MCLCMSEQRSTRELLEILKNKSSYSEAREELEKSQYSVELSEYLHAIADERGMKQSDIMRRSGLKKSYFYQLFDGKRENPSRDTLIQLSFGFRFTLDETQDFLKHLGAAMLYPRIARDGAIIFAIQHSMDIIECDILLAENGEKPLMKT